MRFIWFRSARLQVDVPVDPFLYEKLTKCGVETDILSKSNFVFYGRALLALLPSVAIILYIRAVQYRAKEKFSEKIYDLLKMNRRQLILVRTPPPPEVFEVNFVGTEMYQDMTFSERALEAFFNVSGSEQSRWLTYSVGDASERQSHF